MPTITDLDNEEHLLLQAPRAPPKSFQYTALPPRGWIRLLELHPGPGALSCTLQTKQIATAATEGFEALSYVWGDDSGHNVAEIECGGRVLSVGANLAGALTHLRPKTNHPRRVWVDAVCINQADRQERSRQVQQMGEIYAGAGNVLIWIGADPKNEAQECFGLIKDTTAFLMETLGDDVEHPPMMPQADRVCSDATKWDMVRGLMDAEWFGRVWVLQEVGLARSATVIWGDASMNWSWLVELMLHVALRADVATRVGNVRAGTVWDTFEDVWRGFANTDTWRNELPLTRHMNGKKTDGNQRLVDILNDLRNYRATDQRDRVYAFLSHPGAGHHSLVADYNRSVDDVYLDTAVKILGTDSCPWTVLSCVDHVDGSSSLSGGRPSWVPRWDEDWRVYWLGYPGMWYRAGGEEAAFQFEVSASPSSLRLSSAVPFDSVAWSSPPFQADDLLLAAQKGTGVLQNLWRDLEPETTAYGDDVKDGEHAFSLALVAGRASDEGPAEDDRGRHEGVYRAYKDMLTDSHSDSHGDSNPASSGDQGQTALEALTYVSNQRRALHNRRLFRTQRGYVGVGHASLEIGDVCHVVRGANVPFLLKKTTPTAGVHQDTGEAGRPCRPFRLVGECYVQGIMKGEVWRMVEDGGGLGLDDDCGVSLTPRDVILV